MKHDIKLIAIDIDGTLVDTDKRVSERTAKAVKRAADRGIIMCLATGRPMHGLPQDVYKTEGFGYGIFSGGAIVAKIPENEVLVRKLIPKDRARHFMQILMSFEKTAPEVYYDGDLYIQKDRMEIDPKEFEVTYSNRTKRNIVPDIMEFMDSRTDDPEKFYCLFKYQEDKRKAEQALKAGGELDVVSSLRNNLEISRADATKGRAFTELLNILGIDASGTMVIGDSENDRTILEKAGYKVVMGNARNSVRVIADEITDTNDKDGVALTLERFLDDMDKLGL